MSSFDRATVALVTGAGSGIGAAVARRLRRDGVGGLVLVDRAAAGLATVRAELERGGAEVLERVHDVADAAAWAETGAAVRARFARLDLAVANAGIADGGVITDYPFDAWRRVMAANADGVFLTLQQAMRLMQPAADGGRGGGAIVVVASAAGMKAEPGVGAYSASKAAALQLMRVAAKEGAPVGIRVNAVAPGGVETPIWRDVPFFQELVREHGSEAAAFAAMAAQATPVGRFATADEVAHQIVGLLSDTAAMITGATLVMDGGYSL